MKPERQHVYLRWALILVCLITMITSLWYPVPVVQAQIITDGSLGPGVSVPGPDFRIPAEMGQIRGGNLFHSFEQFNIYADESATFTGPDTIAHILARVTGGNASNIFGPLQSEIPSANFFLLNPNGVLLGPGASVDVDGSFHVSTADLLILQDRGVFHSNLSQNSVLTTAAPAAFGFLSANPAAILMEGGRIEVPDGESVSIVGGEIMFLPPSFRRDSNGAIAPGGQVQLLSVSSPGEIVWNATGELVPEDPAMLGGDITVKAGGLVSVAGVPGGRIILRGGQIRLDDGIVDAHVDDDAAAGSIRLDGASIRVDQNSRLTSGQLALTADRIEIDNRSLLAGEMLALSAGEIEIRDESQLNGREISIVADAASVTDEADVNSLGRGAVDAGSIVVEVRELRLDSDAQIRTNAIRLSRGNAGVITIQAETVTVSDGAQISSTTQGSGNAGRIVIETQELNVAGGLLQTNALQDSRGDAGQITVAADRVTVTDNGRMQSVTMGPGNAGEISISAKSVEIMQQGHLRARAEGNSSGAAGRIHVISERFVADDARIDSSTRGPGEAGVILFESDEVTLRNDTRLFASARDTDSGSGGEVNIIAKRVSMSGGSRIDNSTAGPDDAGVVTLMAEQIEITDSARILTNARSDSLGSGGRVVLAADMVSVTDRARIESQTQRSGNAGEIVMQARQVTVSGGSRVSANAINESTGNAGQVRIEASESVRVSGQNSEVLSRSAGQGNGGQITFSTPRLIVADEARISSLGPDVSRFGQVDLSQVTTLVLDGGFIDGLHEIVLDGSLGVSGPLDVNDDLEILILAEFGEFRSGNLFHSFDRFRLASGGTAIFTAPDRLQVSTIIARITGDDPILLDGTLRSDITGASLFLLSPQGVLMGSGARLEVDGAFHLSTADYLRFGDDDRFWSDLTLMSELSDGRLEAFGFSDAGAGWIRLQSAELSVGAGLPLSLVGGEITMSSGRLASAGGRLQLVSVASATEVGLTGNGEIVSEGVVTSGGRIRLSSDARVSVEDRGGEAAAGGHILLRGGDVDIANSKLRADAVLNGSAGTITIEAMELGVSEDSEVTAGTRGNSPSAGGLITFVADTIDISDASQINVGTGGMGKAGDIVVRSRELIVSDEGRLQASALPGSEGFAGQIMITSDTVTVTGGGRIRSVSQGMGDGGVITIKATRVDIVDEGRVQTSAQVGSTGNGGQISVTASERLMVGSGGIVESFTQGPGDAGDISVSSGEVRIRSRGRISTGIRKNNDADSGDGGSVTIDAERLVMERNGRLESSTADSGDAGIIIIEAQEIDLRGGAQINTRTTGSGDGGQILITSEQVVMRDNNTRIASTSASAGNAGEIMVKANQIELRNRARIESVAGRGGHAGLITLCTVCQGQSGQIELRQGARIEVSARRGSGGDGGQVQIDTDSLIMLSGSEILGQSQGTGKAGEVFIIVGEMQLTDSRIEVNNERAGTGGFIQVQADTLMMLDNARIDSNTEGSERAGDVVVNATDMMLSGDSRFQASALPGSTGDAGTVTVTAERLTVQDMARIRSVTQGDGDAGTIRITADELTVTNKGRIQTSTQENDSGKAGNIIIVAKTLTVSQVALIESFTLGNNDAGNIDIQAEDMTVVTGAQIRADTRANSTGVGGGVTVNTDRLTIRNGGRINTLTGGAGSAGSVSIEVNRLEIVEAGQISSVSLPDATGAAGSVTIRGREAGTATREVQLSRDGRILTNVQGLGSGADAEVNITANRLTINDFSIITATAEVENAGRITITGLETLEVSDSSITTEAQAGDGGNILIDAQGTIRMRDSQITATVGGGADTIGGNIALIANVVTQQRSQILAQAGQGQGGIINIMADLVVSDVTSDISASSDIEANDGEVNVQGLVADLSGALVPLPKRFGTVANLSREHCVERLRDRGISQFVSSGRNRVPFEPSGVLPSPIAETNGPSMSNRGASRQQVSEREAGLAALYRPVNTQLNCR